MYLANTAALLYKLTITDTWKQLLLNGHLKGYFPCVFIDKQDDKNLEQDKALWLQMWCGMQSETFTRRLGSSYKGTF